MTYEEYKTGCARLDEMSRAYYELDAPIATDAEWDLLKHALEDAEQANPAWKGAGSPSLKPGGKAVKHKKIRHGRRLLSLQDYFSENDLEAWYGRIGRPVVSIEEKIDGLTLALRYENNRLVSGATRGDGDVGEDVTENARHVIGVPETLPIISGVDPEDNMLYVRLEAYQPVAEFLRCNGAREEAGLEPYANPRACAAGGLRSDNFTECLDRGLRAFAFQILDARGWESVRHGSQAQDLKLLQICGFDPVPHAQAKDFAGIWEEVQKIKARKDSLPYWTDGAVVKTDSLAEAAALGEGSKYPVHSAAYKYPAEIKESKVKNIRLQTGRTGVVTPVAEIEPIQLAGTTVSNVTLHNQKFIRDHRINIGCTVAVTKSGEIIPKVMGVPVPADEPFEIKTCPECGHALCDRGAQDGAPTGVMVCVNRSGCPAQALKYLEFFCSKDAMDIKGMGPSAVKTLWDAGLLRHAWDVYDLPYKLESIAALPGFGKASANALAKAVNESKGNDIDRLIKALGIPGVGRHIGRMLAHEYKDLEQIRRLGIDTLMAHDGIGEVTARDFEAFWGSQDGQELYQELKAKGVNTVSKSWKLLEPLSDKAGAAQKPLAGMSIVATGTIQGYTRSGIESFIRENGGTPSGSVSKKTNYLIAGENAGSKLAKAQSLGIPVISVQELEAMCGKT